VVGTAFGIFILLASGMSNVSSSAREEVFMAFPAPALSLTLSVVTLILAYRRGSIRRILLPTISAIVFAGGTMLLALAALRSY
jgi:hypothetical protein